ncbi:putative hippurate hydrolase [Podospora aff. communis PSN243]|uniref:Hippurate hydrolase n=1 Tax=Podospora aff. communis PSN243 TaxID=3040156 RepID=A0AAV9G5N0_9PEZI|nr:putative hippurate hydrolase [Podospora aff. communis PSN243]
MMETETAKEVADRLKSLGYDLLIQPGDGHGVVAILKNGPGRTVMLRAGMDAIPIKELNQLAYKSERTRTDRFGKERPAMHACGHDIHMACLLGAADLLQAARESWSGTLILLFQPGEEHSVGARRMIQQGLFTMTPKPDIIFGQHVARTAAGTVQLCSGPAMFSWNLFDVCLFGRDADSGNYRSPFFPALNIVGRLQNIVKGEIRPKVDAIVKGDGAKIPAIVRVKCGAIENPQNFNFDPDTVDMKISVQTLHPKDRDPVIQVVKAVIRSESVRFKLPKRTAIVESDNIPAIHNDEETVKTLAAAFKEHFGEAAVREIARSELDDSSFSAEEPQFDDFAVFVEEAKCPCVYWNIRDMEPSVFEERGRNGAPNRLPLAGYHSPRYLPVVTKTIETGIDTLALAVLVYLKP